MDQDNRVLCRNGAREFMSKKPTALMAACVLLRSARSGQDRTTGMETLPLANASGKQSP